MREFEKFFKRKYGLTIHDLDNPYINNQEDVQFDQAPQELQDEDALTFQNAKNKVAQLNKARKQEKYK